MLDTESADDVIDDVDSNDGDVQDKPDESAEIPADETPEQKATRLEAALREERREAKRLKERVKEVDQVKDYWTEENKRQRDRIRELESGLAAPKGDQANGGRETEPELKFKPRYEELADYVQRDGGINELVEDITAAVEAKYAKQLRAKTMTDADVEAVTDRTIKGMLAKAQLAEAYPDLQNPDSEFARTVEAHVETMKSDPDFRGTPESGLRRMAADRVHLEMLRTGKVRTKPNGADEDERSRRIASQSGGGRNNAKPGSNKKREVPASVRHVDGLTEKDLDDAYNQKVQVGFQTGFN